MCTPGAGGAGIREQEDSERRVTSFRGVAERGERERGLILHRYQTGAPLLEHAYDDG